MKSHSKLANVFTKVLSVVVGLLVEHDVNIIWDIITAIAVAAAKSMSDCFYSVG